MILRCVAAALLAVPVTVVGPDGLPAPDVAVTCSRGPYALVLTGADGTAGLPDGCLEATCQRGGLLPGTARVAAGEPCRLGRAALLRATVRGLPPDALAQATLLAPGSRRGHGARREGEGFRFDPFPAGAYALVVRRHDVPWTCTTDLGPIGEGEHAREGAWRDPVEVRGTVLGPDGRPFPRVLLHVVYGDGPPAVGETRCEEGRDALDPVTDDGGRYVVRVDPARPFRVEVDAAWRPATVVPDP